MAKFTVTVAEIHIGRVEIEMPDGASREDIIAQAVEHCNKLVDANDPLDTCFTEYVADREDVTMDRGCSPWEVENENGDEVL